MKKYSKQFLFLVIFLSGFLVWGKAEAACSGTSPNLTAASANYADVKSCTDIATYGDVINIPACATGVCVWESGIELTKDVKIIGAGKTATYITNNTTPPGSSIYSYIFKFTPDATSRDRLDSLVEDAAIYEVSGITFQSSSIVTYRAHLWFHNSSLPVVRRVKIHNNRFENVSMSMGDGGYMYGVIYNNEFYNARGPKTGGGGYGSFENDAMTPGDAKGWYIEDNIYTADTSDAAAMIASGTNNGGGWVARYNTANMTGIGGGTTAFESHGNQNDDIYGPQKTEIYGNDINVSQYATLHNARGGKNLIFYNKHKNDDVDDISIWEEYADYTLKYEHPFPRCADSTSTVQICSDSCFCQKVHDSYFFNNRNYTSNALITAATDMDYECREPNSTWCVSTYGSNAADYPVLNNPAEIVQNREWFMDDAVNCAAGGASCTAGIGCGILASRPATCTVGVGYWATDQSCTDLTDMVGANPTTPISGTLYKCTATDTWTEYYTPYTYPHPLRTEVTDIVAPSAPNGLAVS